MGEVCIEKVGGLRYTLAMLKQSLFSTTFNH